jgi:hypothetical protein
MFVVGTAFAVSKGIGGLAKLFATWSRSETTAYVRASRLSEATLTAPIFYIALALWCSACKSPAFGIRATACQEQSGCAATRFVINPHYAQNPHFNPNH